MPWLLLPFAFLLAPATVAGAKLTAQTPPMGWSSWNAFHSDISEQRIKNVSELMVSTGLRCPLSSKFSPPQQPYQPCPTSLPTRQPDNLASDMTPG